MNVTVLVVVGVGFLQGYFSTVRPELEIVTGWGFRLCWNTGSDLTATVPDLVSETEPESEPI